MATKTTGPLYVEPKHRCGDDRFLLLLSNMTGSDVNVTLQHYAAEFTAPALPENWINVLTTVVAVPNETVANLILPIGKDFPYHQFFIDPDSSDVLPVLYLLENLSDAVQDFPLVPAGDWLTV